MRELHVCKSKVAQRGSQGPAMGIRVSREGDAMLFVGLMGAIANNAPWVTDAACTTADPETWFPDRGGSPHAAKRICNSCPVRMDCLRHALKYGEKFGVWGGLTELERRRIKLPTGRTA